MVNNKTADNTCNATAEFNLFGQSMGTLLRCVVMLQNPNQVINNFIKKIKNSVKICFGRNFSSQNFLVNIIWQPTVLHCPHHTHAQIIRFCFWLLLVFQSTAN